MPSLLRVRPDNTFTIVQFTDTHFTNGAPEDEQTLALMSAILEAEQPDLVILTGDVIDGGRCTDPAAAWQLAVSPIVARRLPWAAVYGNHDDEGRLDRLGLMAVQQSIPGCLSQLGPSHISGVGNYVLRILAAQGEQSVAHLYCIDSHAYAQTDIGGYGWIRRDQIARYLHTSHELAEANGHIKLPALAFFHIPLPEYEQVWDFHVCQGVKYEPICAPRINTGFFAALHEAGDVLGTFVGHDHVNDFMGNLHGIQLCYGRATGYNTYGREGMARGARMIRLTKGVRSFQTWLRLEGGEVVTEQPRHMPEAVKALSVG
jgi:hypothetical protein